MYRQPHRWMRTISPAVASKYTAYWETLRPKNDDDVLRAWLFAFMSVHTTWKSNVKGYNAIKRLDWEQDREMLSRYIQVSGVGLHNNRTRYIWTFLKKFRANPAYYRKAPRESWRTYRQRLNKNTLGLGLAKTTFAIELTYPEAPVCCLDVHILRFMTGNTSLNGNMSVGTYEKIEARWLRAAQKVKIASPMARHIYWDQVQGQNDTRYWSHVLEKE